MRPPYFYIGQRMPAIYHTRLRLGMSSLSAHLFPYGLSVSPDCLCGDRETVEHFLLECPRYAAHRVRLLVAVTNIIAPSVHYTMLPLIEKNAFVNMLLQGSSDASYDENCQIFKMVQNYILASERFKRN